MNLVQLRTTASRANREKSVKNSIAQRIVQWSYRGNTELGDATKHYRPRGSRWYRSLGVDDRRNNESREHNELRVANPSSSQPRSQHERSTQQDAAIECPPHCELVGCPDHYVSGRALRYIELHLLNFVVVPQPVAAVGDFRAQRQEDELRTRLILLLVEHVRRLPGRTSDGPVVAPRCR